MRRVRRWLRPEGTTFGCLIVAVAWLGLGLGLWWLFQLDNPRAPEWGTQVPSGAEVIYTDQSGDVSGVRILRLKQGCLIVEEWYRTEWDLSESSAGFLGGTDGIVNGPECGGAAP